MAKTTKEFLNNAAATAAENARTQVTPAQAPTPAIPVEIESPMVDPVTVVQADVDPNNIDVGTAHDPARPGVPPWELNRVPSGITQ